MSQENEKETFESYCQLEKEKKLEVCAQVGGGLEADGIRDRISWARVYFSQLGKCLK